VYAIGGNEEATRLSGISAGFHKTMVYVLSGVASGLAAALLTARLNSAQPIAGINYELDAIAATVIGGTLLSGGVGLVVGSVLGVLVLGLIQTFISFEGTLSSWWTRIVIGALLLVFVVLQRFLVRRRS
jgi:simple sugar transport system permease protein